MATTNTSPLTFQPEEVVAEPFPHIIKDRVIDAALYERLKREFPPDSIFDRNPTTGGRVGRDIYRDDPAYHAVLCKSPAWAELHEYLNSPRFLQLALSLFGSYMRPYGCYTNPDNVRFVDHIEARTELADRSRLRLKLDHWNMRLRKPKQVDEMFVRMDLAQAAEGYAKPVHCDRPNRLISMVIYFCDSDEIGMRGGELVIHVPKAVDPSKPLWDHPRHPRPGKARELLRFRPRENSGLIFLCTNNSYHSVSPVEESRTYRNFIYCSVAGKTRNIWPVT